MHTDFWWGSQKDRSHGRSLENNMNIKIDLRDIGLGGVNWVDLVQGRGR
jgi:hypothetical protein